MKTLKRKITEDSKIEAKVNESFVNGEISGYAAFWDITDLDGDIIRKGAFKRAIDNQIAAKTVPFMIKHFRKSGDVMEMIGTVVEAKEDDIGLWFRAELDGSDVSQQVRQKVANNPKPFGSSIGWLDYPDGFRPMQDGGFEYVAINLKEITLTLLPSQQATIGFIQGKDAESILEEISDRVNKLEEQLCVLQGKESDVEPTEEPAEDVSVEAKSDDNDKEKARLVASLKVAQENRKRDLELLGV